MSFGDDRAKVDRFEQRLLFCLKSASLTLITLYQFLLIAALVRSLGADLFPWVILLAAVGNYVLNADLGFGGYVYAFLRERHVQGRTDETHALIAASLTIYFSIPGVATLFAAAVVPLAFDISAYMTAGVIVFFGTVVASLPWTLIRRVATALDLFLTMEVIEVARRLVFLLLAAMMLFGLPFPLFAFLCAFSWCAAFLIVLIALRRRGVALSFAGVRDVLRFLSENKTHVLRTGGFTGLEFVFFNFPYILIPALSLAPAAIVLFDLFYKVMRFSRVAYNVPIETLLPYQTRAYYEDRLQKVRRYHALMVLISLTIFLAATSVLFFFGQSFFALLIDNFTHVDDSLIYIMIAGMFSCLIQVTSGTFLVAIGAYATLLRISVIAAAMMLGVLGSTLLFSLSFVNFMAIYVVVYFCYSLIYLVTFDLALRRAADGVKMV